MSLFKSIGQFALKAAAGFIPGGTQALSLAQGAVGGDVNIARSLSKQVGCTITQANAARARSQLRAGIDPCTGFSKPSQAGPIRSTIPGPQIPAVFKQVPPGFGPGFGTAQPQVEFAAMATPSVAMSALPAIGRAVVGGGLVRTVSGRASSVILASGQRFSRAKAVALLRRVGLDVGAAALGITLVEAAELLLTSSRAGRRRRGITGAQLATTKRTICTLKRMVSDLGISRAPVRRRKTCR